MSDDEANDPGTQFIPGDNDEEELWDVIEILEEKGQRYKVKWAGNNPSTGKPWAPSWVGKTDCTNDLIAAWKEKKKKKDRRKTVTKVRRKESVPTASSSRPSPPASSKKPPKRRRIPSSALSEEDEHSPSPPPKKKKRKVVEDHLKRAPPQSRPHPNDTFSRDGIVPGTQTSVDADEDNAPVYHPDEDDLYVDWNGGAEPEDRSGTPQPNGSGLSLGPDLSPPYNRTASQSILSTKPRKKPRKERTVSPEIPLPSSYPPPTSTTQRAEVDSQSSVRSNHSARIAALNSALKEQNEKLSLLEAHLKELRAQNSELKREHAENRISFQAERQALEVELDEKSLRISSLEDQLEDLQVKLTHEEADLESKNDRLQVYAEQLAQQDDALLELQQAIESRDLEVERLESSLNEDKDRIAELADGLKSAHEKLEAADAEHAEQLRECESRVKKAEDRADMFKGVYEDASTHAQRLAKENAALEERVAIAESQREAGVAMVRATFEAQITALQGEVERWRGTHGVLAEQSRRTDDELRARAAQEPELREEVERLRREVAVGREEMARMAAIIVQMPAAAQLQMALGGDEEDDGEYVPDDESGSSSSSSSSASGSSHEGGSSDNGMDVPSTPPLPSDEEEDLYVCQYVLEGKICNNTFPSTQGVLDHVRTIHYQDVQMLQA